MEQSGTSFITTMHPYLFRTTVWKHPLLVEPIVIARKDGDDVPDYLERRLKIALEFLKEQGDL